jgi:hypothetical protein
VCFIEAKLKLQDSMKICRGLCRYNCAQSRSKREMRMSFQLRPSLPPGDAPSARRVKGWVGPSFKARGTTLDYIFNGLFNLVAYLGYNFG